MKDEPDYSEHSYSGTVINALNKAPLSGIRVYIYYDKWYPGNSSSWYLPYDERTIVDAFTTESDGKFYLFDSSDDDRATTIFFSDDNSNYLYAEFTLNEKINDKYKIELFPIGTLAIVQTMPYIQGNQILYKYTSKIPVFYTAYDDQSFYTNKDFLIPQYYLREIVLFRLPSCEFDLKATYGTYSGAATLSVIPSDTVYFKLELQGNGLKFNLMDPANLEMPSITITAIKNIQHYGATVEYEINMNDENSLYIFSHGIVWGATENPTIYSNDGIYNSTDYGYISEYGLYDLECGMTYHIRPFLKTINGIVYGNDEILPTLGSGSPVIKTCKGYNITRRSAGFAASINDAIPCEPITDQGFCLGESRQPDLDDLIIRTSVNNSMIYSEFTGLEPNQRYYVRPYATSENGTGFGEEFSFVFPPSDSITDIEGNVYDIVKIGDQWWMAENLKTRLYSDSTAITPGQFFSPNLSSENISDFGLLYNWSVVNNPGKICPEGWHVPSHSEWSTLIDFLGDPDTARYRLKEAFCSHWDIYLCELPENQSGFSARGAGMITPSASPEGFKYNAVFWSTDETDTKGYAFYLDPNYFQLEIRPYEKTSGISVRCIKD